MRLTTASDATAESVRLCRWARICVSGYGAWHLQTNGEQRLKLHTREWGSGDRVAVLVHGTRTRTRSSRVGDRLLGVADGKEHREKRK